MITRLPEGRPFLKMHGLGNDFVLLDGRIDAPRLSSEMIQALADRRTGIGFDQLITLLPAPAGQADAFMSIHNADGSQVAACGNASRCVAWLLMQESSRDHITLATRAGLLSAWGAADGQITVDMGPARLEWQDIPLAQASDTLHLPLTAGPLCDGVAVSMGNPHAVFFVADAEAIDLSLSLIHI